MAERMKKEEEKKGQSGGEKGENSQTTGGIYQTGFRTGVCRAHPHPHTHPFSLPLSLSLSYRPLDTEIGEPCQVPSSQVRGGGPLCNTCIVSTPSESALSGDIKIALPRRSYATCKLGHSLKRIKKKKPD